MADMTAPANLIGKRFGRLTVISRAPRTRLWRARWACLCACGTETIVPTNRLSGGETKSCGCRRREMLHSGLLNKRHGMTDSAEHRIWRAMLTRCRNKNTIQYRNYGGRGIVVCDRWQTRFENFLADMGLRPSAQHSIDRINNDGNYEPGNCRWATRSEQARNTRRTAQSSRSA